MGQKQKKGGAPCSTAFDYRVDIGALLLVGPSPLQQDRTCVMGQTCRIAALEGARLSATDRLQLLETCGVPAPVQGVPSDGYAARSSAGAFSWGIVTANAGIYRLCWCSSLGPNAGCDVAGDFVVDVGGLAIAGPGPLGQDRTCVAGKVCAVDGLDGLWLSSSDMLLVTGAFALGALRASRLGVRNLWSCNSA